MISIVGLLYLVSIMFLRTVTKTDLEKPTRLVNHMRVTGSTFSMFAVAQLGSRFQLAIKTSNCVHTLQTLEPSVMTYVADITFVLSP